ncbi:MAG TPA: nitrate reductase molybdenum cofactor assembly chaperone [Bacillales bacterium]|nr:nitrate reductase molybdenum cofactor assembly chaperone [Bacillales bacterium]
MNSEQSVFKLASFLLGYPDDEFWRDLDKAATWLSCLEATSATQNLQNAITALRQSGETAVVHHYISTFDFSESSSLYLTAHEYGDNRARGNALVNLRILLASEGYEQADNELADFLPLLLEFMADCNNEEKTNLLKPRLAKVAVQIHDNLDENSPYAFIFSAIAAVLPRPEDQQFPDREEADNEENMPYPLLFQ